MITVKKFIGTKFTAQDYEGALQLLNTQEVTVLQLKRSGIIIQFLSMQQDIINSFMNVYILS